MLDLFLKQIDVLGVFFVLLVGFLNYLFGLHLQNFSKVIELFKILGQGNDRFFKLILQLSVEILEPDVLINISLLDIVSVGSRVTSLLLFFLEDLKNNLLLNLGHSIYLLDHFVEDVHNCHVEIVYSCGVVEPGIIEGTHEVSLE